MQELISRALLAQFSGDEKRIVATFTNSLFEAYVDEGGTHAGSPIIAVAGFFGLHCQWSKFLDNWKHVEFHACDSRFDRFKPELADAIDVAELCGTEVCISPPGFAALASGDIKAHLGNPYAIGVFICAVGICERCQDVAQDARISFVLEDGQPNVDWVRRMLIMMMQEYPIASVTVVKKADFPQLHPADFLAHSRATSDTPWLDRLFEKKRVSEIPIYPDILASTSVALADFMKRYRNQKAKERQARRRGRVAANVQKET